ncbi:HD domain-containing protein [Fictibacillus halophilus]|uniref:HD domain-containing protein n=1 Tax=Fictibacillus halophilus TaxID=1610490 RepID=UPI001CF9F364|nr:HD domain-containing protein [Fictibacillus halophilus]
MLVKDEIYGEYEVEAVLQDLIQSQPVQRLKGIHQGGASYLVNPTWNVTRYEHSIGVMLLIRRLGGPIEEQIAGLLHDVSHTAFSHVIDFVLKNESENFHEEIFEDTLLQSDVPKILKKHGFSMDVIFKENFPLLEQPLPLLCADRIDYTLRDLSRYNYITTDEIEAFLPSLCVNDSEISIKGIQHAEWFVQAYYKEVQDFFMNPLNVYGYDKLIKLLQEALRAKVITNDDFLLTDEEVLEKIRHSGEFELNRRYEEIINPVNLQENEKEYEIHLKVKPRLIDPTVIDRDRIAAASEISSAVKEMNERAKERARKGSYIKVI